jgi:two-component system, sensor histidine kinase LadS
MMASFHRFFALLLCTSALLGVCTSAQAQLATAPQSGLQLTRLDVLHNVPTGLSLTAVLSGQAGAFVETTDLQISHPHWYRSMWLRLHLKAAPNPASTSDQAVLFFPKPYLDDLRLYTPGKQAGEPWAMQRAGDFVPPSLWPTRSLHPKFLLPSAERVAASQGQSMVLYLQMDHLAPVMLGLNLGDSKDSLEEDALSLLMYGLGLGAILISALLTAALAWIHRDAIYAWYGLYAIAALLACASHSGIAHHVLWPIGGIWPGTAVLWFLMLSCIGQIQFARCLNLVGQPKRGLGWVAHSLCAACLVNMVCFPIFDAFWKQMYFATLALVAITTLFGLIFMLHGWRNGNKLARVWLLAYMPLAVTVVIALLEGVGIMPSTYWSYSLVILAVCLEVLILGLALQWFARDRHGEKERQRALASTDPLTGFSTASAFQAKLADYWQQLSSSTNHRSDCAIAYIQLINLATARPSEQILARLVRVLRSATRSQDWVGLVNTTTMAIVIPDISMTEDLDQRLARVIALGLMPDKTDRQYTVLQMRIAATTFKSFSGHSLALDTQLMNLLSQSKGWGSRPIRYLNANPGSQNNQPLINDSSLLDEIWDNAVLTEATDQRAIQARALSPSPSPASREPLST